MFIQVLKSRCCSLHSFRRAEATTSGDIPYISATYKLKSRSHFSASRHRGPHTVMSIALPNPTTPLAWLPEGVGAQLQASEYLFVAALGVHIGVRLLFHLELTVALCMLGMGMGFSHVSIRRIPAVQASFWPGAGGLPDRAVCHYERLLVSSTKSCPRITSSAYIVMATIFGGACQSIGIARHLIFYFLRCR